MYVNKLRCEAKVKGYSSINAAVLLWHIRFWVAKNKANEKHFYDGRYWTYNSVKAFSELFPEFTKSQISIALKKLEDCGAIVTGNYNSSPYDRTKWYALADENDLIKNENGNKSDEKSTNKVTDIKPNIKTDIDIHQGDVDDETWGKFKAQMKSRKKKITQDWIDDVKREADIAEKDGTLNAFLIEKGIEIGSKTPFHKAIIVCVRKQWLSFQADYLNNQSYKKPVETESNRHHNKDGFGDLSRFYYQKRGGE